MPLICQAEAFTVTDGERGQPVDAREARIATPRIIRFSNGRTAKLVETPVGVGAPEILAELRLNSSCPVIAVVGGANNLNKRVKPRLTQLFSRAVARVAAERGALIIDGGTDAGVMALIGQGVADRGHCSALLGVAPVDKVTYPDASALEPNPDHAPLEPNHTHFVLVRHADWGGELGTMDDLARALAGDKPAVTILADGGPIAVEEVVRSVRRQWPVVILAGSGRLADQLIKLSRSKNTKGLADSRLAEIIAEGNLHVIPRTAGVEDLRRVLNRYLDPPDPDPALDAAWRLFAWLDLNAKTERSSFERLQGWIISLGVLATLLALVQSQLGLGLSAEVSGLLPGWLAALSIPAFVSPGLQFALVVVTVVTTILLGAVARFKSGSRWVLLRGGAEAVKREIYRYRAGADPYTSLSPANIAPRSEELTSRLNAIANQVFTTEISELALRPYQGAIPPPMYGAAADDNGFVPLSANQYVAIRVGDQISYFRSRVMQLDRRLRRAQWATLTLGGLATLLAAVGAQLWVPLTAAIIAAIATFLEYQQVGATLAKYNQAIANLLGIQAWWAALPDAEQSSREFLNRLVASTEDILGAELSGWVRQMHDALDRLRRGAEPGTAQGNEEHQNSG